MTHAIDLRRHHFMREWKDLCIFGSWLMNEEQEDLEPCLVILPRFRHPKSVKPAVVALSSAFKYNEATYLAHASALFAQGMGMTELSDAYKVADAIYNHLGDLLSMPENPVSGVVVADASVRIGNTTRTVEILDYQSTPQL